MTGCLILTGLRASIGVTHSYSSRPFLCALVTNQGQKCHTKFESSFECYKEGGVEGIKGATVNNKVYHVLRNLAIGDEQI